MDAVVSVDGGSPNPDPVVETLPYYLEYNVVLTGKKLGSGAYGEVLEAELPGGVCAVKKMQDAYSTQEVGWNKFDQECKVLSRLHHPHIVQFLGVARGIPGFNIPAIVTEKLLTDLRSMVLPESPSLAKPYIPLDLKFSVLHDVAGGLLFLHSQNIIHRDLTPANVLVNSAMVAKIADLGMARLVLDGTKNLSKLPGNLHYMPPEAEGDDYNESLDVFSFGVLTLFTLIQSDPVPKSRVKGIEKGKAICRTEVQRRSTYLGQLRDQLKGQEGLVEVVEQCLHDDPAERPKIQDKILPHIKSSKLKTSTKYLGMSKLDLLQTVERERKERKKEQEKHKREQQEEIDRHRKEQEKLKEEHNKEQGKHKKELIQVQRKLDQYTVQTKQKDKVIQQKAKVIKQTQQDLQKKEGNYKLAMKAKQEELEEMVRQTKQEKSAAVQQKEMEIVAELREILWSSADRREESGGIGGNAVGNGCPVTTKVSWSHTVQPSVCIHSKGYSTGLFFSICLALQATRQHMTII